LVKKKKIIKILNINQKIVTVMPTELKKPRYGEKSDNLETIIFDKKP
jgi:hypothetical protein